MNAEFCPRDCEHLSINEAEQSEGNKHHKPHICLKYNTRVFHCRHAVYSAHPDLWRCEQCYKETKECE